MKTAVNLFFGSIVFAIGVANLIYIHPVPGIVFILLSLVYLPMINNFLNGKFGFAIPVSLKVVLAVVIIWFTLGVSDLGDMIDNL